MTILTRLGTIELIHGVEVGERIKALTRKVAFPCTQPDIALPGGSR